MSFKNFFSEQAREPSGFFGRFIMSRIFELGNVAINDFMKELISLQENDHVLEIGFGTGKLISEMAKLVKKGLIEGTDLSNTMVALAEKKNRNYIAEGKVIIRQGDFELANYNANSFDKVCSANTIYFWPHPDNCIKKILRILRPGGKSILAFEDKAQMERRALSANVFRIYSRDEIEDLLRRNGFSKNINVISREVKSMIYHCAVAMK
jgi:ubiquinone/menaquinone biosynthesis C-methylase UbiE